MIYSLLCEGGSIVYSGGSARLLKNPLVSSDFIWDEDNSPTLWVEADSKETHWDNGVHMHLEPPTFKFWVTGPTVNFRILRKDSSKEYWLEAGGTCGMWLEEDNRTYTEWWDEVETLTPWDQGKTPWDTTNTLDTAWDREGTGEFEKTYWYDFIPIGIFITQGQNAGRGYYLQANEGEFNVDFTNILYNNEGKRTKQGAFKVTVYNTTKMHLSQAKRASTGHFLSSGKAASSTTEVKGIIDYTLSAETCNLVLSGGNSKGKYREGGCVRNPTDWDQHNPNYTEWDQHNYRETWWDTHKLRCLHPQPGVFTLTGQEALFDDYAHLASAIGTFTVNAGQEVEWDNLTTIWQEDDLITDTNWYDGEIENASFERTAYSGVGKFVYKTIKVGEREDFNLAVECGSFVVTSEESSLTNNKAISLKPASVTYNLSGQAYYSVSVGADNASYTVISSTVSYQTDIRSKVDTGEFKLESIGALSTTDFTLSARRESYAITGWKTNHTTGFGADAAEFTVSTQDTLVKSSIALKASAADFTLYPSIIGRGYKLPLADYSFTMVGYETNVHQVINFTRGQFSVEVAKADRERHLTLKVEGAASFLLKGDEVNSSIKGTKVTPASFRVSTEEVNSHIDLVSTLASAHYNLSGFSAKGIIEDKPVAEVGIFFLDCGNTSTELTWNKEVVSTFSTGVFNVGSGHTLEEGLDSLRLSADCGEFSVSYDCSSTSFKAEAGEFISEGGKAFFNSNKHVFNAGPNSKFIIELQGVGRYGDHDYNRTTEYVLTGSPISFRCGKALTDWDKHNVEYTDWDELNYPQTWWDAYSVECVVSAATVIPATFTVDTVEISGYADFVSTDELPEVKTYRQYFTDWDSYTNWDDTNSYMTGWDPIAGVNVLRAESSKFVIELEKVSYYDYTIYDEGNFTVTGNGVGGTADINGSRVTWDIGLTEWVETDVTSSETITTLWYDEEGISETVSGYSGVGTFNLNGEEAAGDHWVPPANVYLIADYLHLKVSDGCQGIKETFWDNYNGTRWIDDCYGETSWYSRVSGDDAIVWDEGEHCSPMTNWDKHKSRWDRRKCTNLGVEHHMIINCK